MTWQRFTQPIRESILLGQQEAARLDCPYVSTEHVLLGLMQTEGLGAQVLQKMGVAFEEVRQEIENEVGPSNKTGVTQGVDSVTKLTPGLEQLYKLAADESARMNLDYVGSEHMLLALIREEDGLAAKVLHRQGLRLDAVRTEVRQQLKLGGDNGNK